MNNLFAIITAGLCLALIGCKTSTPTKISDPIPGVPTVVTEAEAAAAREAEKKRPPLPKGNLLDRGFDDWKVYRGNKFERAGLTGFERGSLILSTGGPYTGASLKTKFPKENYEVSLEARRTEGGDIFCGIYFPVGKSTCSMVLGGWGNSLSGLSMVDGMFASENETAYPSEFKNNTWVKVRLRVTSKAISIWTDEKRIIHIEREDRRIEPYPGLEVFEPFGFFTYESSAEIRTVNVRTITPEDDKDE